MDKLSFPEMQSVLKQMEEVTKCSNCLRVLTPPLRCCVNGHCVCKMCNNCECPICEEDVKCTDLQIIIKKVLSILPKECEYFTEGCNRMLLLDTLKDHKKVCIFRTVNCCLEHCTWKGQANNLLEHLTKGHPNNHIFHSDSEVYWKNINPNEDRSDVAPTSAFGCIFWHYFKIDTSKGKHLTFVTSVPTCEESVQDFYSVITFKNKNSVLEYKYFQKVFKENENIKQIYFEENCMAVPLSEIHHFIVNTNQLTYHVKIIPCEAINEQ